MRMEEGQVSYARIQREAVQISSSIRLASVQANEDEDTKMMDRFSIN